MGLFGNIFEKKVLIYQKRDRETWQQIKDALKSAGITGVSASHYDQDTVNVGPGAPIDPRNFAGGKKVDRDIYTIRVPESQEEAARAAIRGAGLTAVVDPDIHKDASQRHPVV